MPGGRPRKDASGPGQEALIDPPRRPGRPPKLLVRRALDAAAIVSTDITGVDAATIEAARVLAGDLDRSEPGPARAKTADLLLRYLRELKMTPLSRGDAKDDTHDPFDALLSSLRDTPPVGDS